jgi:ribosome biogenesis GTPase / thiamine phosphate phosphatase
LNDSTTLRDFVTSRERMPVSDTRVEGILIRQHRSHYVVRGDDGIEYLCGVSSKLHKNLKNQKANTGSRRDKGQRVKKIDKTSAAVVGDRVSIEPGDEQSMIMVVHPRQSVLSRESPGRRNLEQIIAANVDQVLAVMSIQQPSFNTDLLNRLLVGAEFQGLDVVICATKTDLGIPDDVQKTLDGYRDMYQVITSSVVTEDGLETVRDALSGKTSVAIGLSGVGKTSLLNALEPELDLRVQTVNDKTGQGRHTTTHAELVALSGGGHLVDAPGLRELSLWSADEDTIATLFPEFRPILGTCRFGGSCIHRNEPGCEIKEAVDQGEIPRHRYSTYLSLRKQTERAVSDIRDRRRPRPSG